MSTPWNYKASDKDVYEMLLQTRFARRLTLRQRQLTRGLVRMGRDRSRNGKREKLGCDQLSLETSGDLMVWSNDRIILQNCSKLEQECGAFVSLQ